MNLIPPKIDPSIIRFYDQALEIAALIEKMGDHEKDSFYGEFVHKAAVAWIKSSKMIAMVTIQDQDTHATTPQ